MAPATIAGAPTRVLRGRGGWDRDSIIQAIREWVAIHGEPPRAADWNPSSAKWAGQTWRVERYRAGRPDGSPWPALNSAKRPFGGSLKRAIEAAGFQPAKPGPKRRTDVHLEQADRADMGADGRALLDAALAQTRAADRRVAALEGQLVRVRDRAARLAGERDAARRDGRASTMPKVVRERVVDEAAVARARKRADAVVAKADVAVREARERADVARAETAEARTAAQRLASRSERSEATVATLRGERRALKAELDRASDRATALERLLTEAERAPTVVRVREEAPEAAAVRAATQEAARARRAAAAAELRAAAVERELGETVAAIRGEVRRLTPAELAELRSVGPSGPAVMAAALQELATARRTQSPTATAAALGRVAQAAVTWRERI
jgi:hypothetical protein